MHVFRRKYPAGIELGKSIIRIKIEQKICSLLLPGFIDAHIHIESSLLVPPRFAEVAIAYGTTAVICDFHEIANVAGMKGYNGLEKMQPNHP